MIDLSLNKISLLNAILPVVDPNIITLQKGQSSIQFNAKNTPLLVINADLVEYAIAPLNLDFLSSVVKDLASVDNFPFELIGALLEKEISPYIKNTNNIINTQINVVSYKTIAAVSDYIESIDFSLNQPDGRTLPLRLYFKNDTCIGNFLEKIKRLDKKSTLEIDKLSMQLDKIIGSQRFNVSEIKELEVGDAILMAENYIAQKSILLKNEKFACLVNISDTGETTVAENGINFSYKETVLMENIKNSKIENITLKVEFSLGTIEKTIEELNNLTEGSIIDLEKIDPSNITIKINNQTIGYGQLIKVNDAYAVQLTNIDSKS